MDPINNQNSSGMMNGMPPQPKEEKKLGPIVGVVVVILLLIVAALFFFGKDLNTTPIDTNIAPVGIQDESSIQPAEDLTAGAANADDVDTLQAELESELQDIDYSF